MTLDEKASVEVTRIRRSRIPLPATVRKALEALCDILGIEIRAPGGIRRTMAESLGRIGDLGFRPQTVIDVGVASGTFELYDAFPDAGHLLIEPLAEFEGKLQGICRKYKAQYVLAAASNETGRTTIHVHPDLQGSSFLREIEGEYVDGNPRQVPTITIDEVVANRDLKGPFVIKVDVQGAELMVLEGARVTLSQTELVILEVSLFGTLVGGPMLHDIVTYVRERGFVVYDIFGGLFRPLDKALAQVDIVFAREDGPFRRVHAYATPAQRLRMIENASSRRPPR